MSVPEENPVKETLMEYRHALRIVSPSDSLEQFLNAGKKWRKLPKTETINTSNTFLLLSMLTNARCAETNGNNFHQWGTILDQEIVEVSKGVDSDFLFKYANQVLKPLTKGKFSSSGNYLNGVKICTKLINTHIHLLREKKNNVEADEKENILKLPEDWLQLILSLQLYFLEKTSILGSSFKQTKSGSRIIKNFLLKWPKTSYLRNSLFLPCYMNIILTNEIELMNGMMVIMNVINEDLKSPNSKLESTEVVSWRKVFLTKYADLSLSSAQNKACSIETFKLVIENMTITEYEEIVLPKLEKLLRLSPESGIRAVADFTQTASLSLDPSKHLNIGLISTLLKLIRSASNDEAAYFAHRTLSNFLCMVNEPSVLQSLMREEVLEKLNDKKDAQLGQRNSEVGVLQSLLEPCNKLPSNEKSAMAVSCLSVLMANVKKEQNPVVKTQLVSTAAGWMVLLNETDVVAVIDWLLSHISVVPLAVLGVLGEASKQLPTALLAPALPHLLTIVSASAKKSKTPQTEAVIALDLFLNFSKGVLNKESKFIETILTNSASFLYAANLYNLESGARVTPLQWRHLTALPSILLIAAKNMGMAKVLFDLEGPAGLLLARCAVSEVQPVREAAVEAFKQLAPLHREVAQSFGSGLLSLLLEEAIDEQKLNGTIRRAHSDSDNGDSSSSFSSSVCPPPPFFTPFVPLKTNNDLELKKRKISASSLRACISAMGQTTSKSALPQLLILCSHPSVASSEKHGHHLWKSTISTIFQTEVLQLEAVLSESQETFGDILIKNLTSNCTIERKAGNRAMYLLMLGEAPTNLAGVQLVEALVFPSLLAMLSEASTSLSAITKQDLDLLHCPPNKLLAEFMKPIAQPSPSSSLSSSSSSSSTSSGTPAGKVNKTKGVKGGGFGAEAEELAWEEQVRAELEQKKRAKAEAAAAAVVVVAKPTATKTKSKKEKKEEEELAALGLGGVATKKKKKETSSKSTKSSSVSSAITKASSSSSSSSTVAAVMTPEAKQLLVEGEKRDKIKLSLCRANASLRATSSAASALSVSRNEALVTGHGLKGNFLSNFLQPVYSLLQFDYLLLDSAFSCLKCLTLCLDDRFRYYQGLAAPCLRLAVLSESASMIQGDLMTTFGKELHMIVVRSRGASPFTASTAHFLYPILDAIIRNSSVVADKALDVVSVIVDDVKAVNDEQGQPASSFSPLRIRFMELLLYILNQTHFADHKVMVSSATRSLSSLCATSAAMSAQEWSVLFHEQGLIGAQHARVAALTVVKDVLALQDAGVYHDLGLGHALLESRLWLSCHDMEEHIRELGRAVWAQRGQPVSEAFVPPLIELLGHTSAETRGAAAYALAGGLSEHPSAAGLVNSLLQDLFIENKEPEADPKGAAAALSRGISIEEYLSSALPSADGCSLSGQEVEKRRTLRMACCDAFGQCGKAKVLGHDQTTLTSAMNFLISTALSDPIEAVRSAVMTATQGVVDGYGASDAPLLLSLLETSMAQGCGKGQDALLEDKRKEGLVVLLGAVAKHLDKTDPKVTMIISSLLDALSIPSESVQRCVANSLAPLIASVRSTGGEYLDILLARAIESESEAERRGAAYGVSAVVKGLGIGSLKQRNVMVALESACTSSPTAKQGALFCFELLCDRLRILFEPYIVSVLPLLLRCFSDSSQHVRDGALPPINMKAHFLSCFLLLAAHGAARVIMKHLSQHGVKLVLPKILEALEDPAWRTKQAAIQLLGAMAHCAPKPLGHCLPQIVPRLTAAFGDTHPKVRESGKRALKDVRSVVRNPEVAGLSDVLLLALTEPSKHTKSAIDALLVCEFIHSIDAPSLALLVPVLQRGLKERSADVKRKAALISGNMSSMISDPKDLLPYLPSLLPGLKETVLDPIPDVRSTSSKAIGQLAMGLGEEHISEVLPWLVETLKTSPGTVERCGAAQGISEVLAALGDEKTREMLNDLLPLASHPSVGVREGVLWLLVFLPSAIASAVGDFSQYLEKDALPVVLAGLADDLEQVREVALKAGQVLVASHGKSHLELILPALEQGIRENNWRIRHSSVTLLGDLLYLLGNTKACVQDEGEEEETFEQDDGRGDANATKMVAQALGVHRRNEILAALYILRSDSSSVVRQSTLQVWKTMVPNTPRVLREILPNVITQIISSLANGSADRRAVAGRALGDVVKKLGERVLPDMIPFMRGGLSDESIEKRQGICLGLAEVLACITKRQLESYVEEIIECVEVAICDSEEDVRKQASLAFLTLHRLAGPEAVDVILPSLLRQLTQDSTRQRALNGLCQMLKVRSRELLSVVVPALLKRPMSEAHMVALGTVAQSSSQFIHHIAYKIIPVLVAELEALDAAALAGDDDASRKRDLLDKSAGQFMGAITTEGIPSFAAEVLKPMVSEHAATRAWGVHLLGLFFSENKVADYDDQIPVFIKELVRLFTDDDRYVLDNVRDSLSGLVKSKPLEELLPHMDFTRNYIVSLISEARHRKGAAKGPDFCLPLFNIPKGIEPLLVFYQYGLLNGSSAQREVAASGIGDLVEYTSPQELKPFLIKMTGPLIRVVGDKFPGAVKAAILQSLLLLLEKGGAAQKPFVPQLQKSFVKALGDPTTAVRFRAALALGQLMELSTRVDPLVTDLINSASSPDHAPEVAESYLTALGSVFSSSGSKVSLKVKEASISGLMSLLSHSKDNVRVAAATTLSCIAVHLDDEKKATESSSSSSIAAEEDDDDDDGNETLERLIVTPLLQTLNETDEHWQLKHGASQALTLCCSSVLVTEAHSLSTHYLEIMKSLLMMLRQGHNKNVYLQIHACEGLVLLCKAIRKKELTTSIMSGLHAFVTKSELYSSLVEAFVEEVPDVKVSVLACLKSIAKSFKSATKSNLRIVMPCLLDAVKDTNIRVKLAAERALIHALEVHSRPATLDEFASSVDNTTARFVRDYVRKVLVRLQPESEIE